MNEAQNDGGPAFPTADGNASDGEKTVEYSSTERGMSLRDWFAGQCIVGYDPAGREAAETLARSAYQMADAMLAARSGSQP